MTDKCSIKVLLGLVAIPLLLVIFIILVIGIATEYWVESDPKQGVESYNYSYHVGLFRMCLAGNGVCQSGLFRFCESEDEACAYTNSDLYFGPVQISGLLMKFIQFCVIGGVFAVVAAVVFSCMASCRLCTTQICTCVNKRFSAFISAMLCFSAGVTYMLAVIVFDVKVYQEISDNNKERGDSMWVTMVGIICVMGTGIFILILAKFMDPEELRQGQIISGSANHVQPQGATNGQYQQQQQQLQTGEVNRRLGKRQGQFQLLFGRMRHQNGQVHGQSQEERPAQGDPSRLRHERERRRPHGHSQRNIPSRQHSASSIRPPSYRSLPPSYRSLPSRQGTVTTISSMRSSASSSRPPIFRTDSSLTPVESSAPSSQPSLPSYQTQRASAVSPPPSYESVVAQTRGQRP